MTWINGKLLCSIEEFRVYKKVGMTWHSWQSLLRWQLRDRSGTRPERGDFFPVSVALAIAIAGKKSAIDFPAAYTGPPPQSRTKTRHNMHIKSACERAWCASNRQSESLSNKLRFQERDGKLANYICILAMKTNSRRACVTCERKI